MVTLVDNDNIRVAVTEHDSSTATLCFTGIGHAIGGVNIQSEEFRKASKSTTSFFIIDKKRSWGNNLDFSCLRALVAPYIKDKKINTIGNSMGGFLAILATKFFPVDVTIAICPQYSVSKAVLPSESRFDKYVNEIKEWKFESLADCFNQTTRYYILSGVGGSDDQHTELIPKRANIHKILFRHHSFIHEVAQRLKKDGLLYDVIEDCFESKSPTEIIRSRFANVEYQTYEA